MTRSCTILPSVRGQAICMTKQNGQVLPLMVTMRCRPNRMPMCAKYLSGGNKLSGTVGAGGLKKGLPM